MKPNMKGVFGLCNASDLFHKLEWEFNQLNAKPTNPYIAYNFFVTAWHLLEWKHPDCSDKEIKAQRKLIREQMLKQEPLLQICEHLAIGAKHFEPLKKGLNAVAGSKESSCWADGVWASVWKKVWDSWLVVELDGAAQEAYGNQIKVQKLAHHVMKYWRSVFDTESQSDLNPE